MSATTSLLVVGLVLAFVLVARPLGRVGITGPVVFVAAGTLLDQVGVVAVGVDSGTVKAIVEITLGLALFSDASTVDLSELRSDTGLPARLLAIGLPVTVAVGTLAAYVVLPSMSWSAAALVAASLAATDASLSAGVLADRRVPARIRRALNLESGLNDGLATPMVIAAIAATASYLGLAGEHGNEAFAVELLGGVVLGAVAGAAGAALIRWSGDRGWSGAGDRRIATLALALCIFGVADAVGASPFIAAFVGGISFAAVSSRTDDDVTELPEYSAEVLSWVTWFIFGASLLLPSLDAVDWRIVAYAVLSLTVLRMVPVALSLTGSSANVRERLFLGWFGPRGLATVVFGLLIVEQLGSSDPAVRTVLSTLTVTIVMSIVAHGITASPLTRWVAGSRGGAPTTAEP